MNTQRSTIIVLGAFRSGTSLVARMLSALGVDFGPPERMLKADRFNPDGYFQHKSIRIANNRLLRSVGASVAWPADPVELAERGDLVLLRRVNLDWEWHKRTRGIKDPRFCATLLAWFGAGVFDASSTTIVHVRRDRATAAQNLLGMPELARQLPEKSLAAARTTIDRYADLAAWHVQELDLPGLAVDYEALLARPQESVRDLAAFAGCRNAARITRALACIRPIVE